MLKNSSPDVSRSRSLTWLFLNWDESAKKEPETTLPVIGCSDPLSLRLVHPDAIIKQNAIVNTLIIYLQTDLNIH